MKKNKYILALDQGTTSSRGIVFDKNGKIKGVGQLEFKQYYPKKGYVEHDPMEIWNSQLYTAREALRKANVVASDIKAIGITNQRETTILWEKETGIPIYNAIVWQDRRTSNICEKLYNDGYANFIKNRTGLVVDSYFSGTKLSWLLNNFKNFRKKSEKGKLAFGTVDTWLIWHLTNGKVHCTDYSNASRTLLFDIHTKKWNEKILEILNIPSIILPKIVPSSKVIGYSSPVHFGGSIPISGIAGDQQSATFGQACFKPGMVKSTYGTGCFMLMNVGNRPVKSKNRLLSTIGWQIKNSKKINTTYMIEGGIFMAGSTIQWLRDGLKIINNSQESEIWAKSIKNSEDVFMVPAFVGLGAPHWDPYARGLIIGLTRGTSIAHIVRAALESIALQSTELQQAMVSDSKVNIMEMRVDGGASKNNFLMQLQANLLGVPVIRPVNIESSAWGAAGLAGLAVNYWENKKELISKWTLDRIFEPNWSKDQREEHIFRWKQAVKLCKNWALNKK